MHQCISTTDRLLYSSYTPPAHLTLATNKYCMILDRGKEMWKTSCQICCRFNALKLILLHFSKNTFEIISCEDVISPEPWIYKITRKPFLTIQIKSQSYALVTPSLIGRVMQKSCRRNHPFFKITLACGVRNFKMRIAPYDYLNCYRFSLSKFATKGHRPLF